MKILMILETSLPDIRVENEIYSLQSAGHKVTLFCSGDVLYMKLHGADVFGIRIPKLIRKSFIAHPWLKMYESFWERELIQFLGKHDFDAIHVHDLPLARLGVMARQLTGCKFVLDLHENYPALLKEATHTKKILGRILHNQKAWERLEKWAVDQADEVIVICSEAYDRIRSIAEGRPWIVENTVNTKTMPDFSFQKPSNIECLRLFYGGGINKHRGIQTVIEAIRYLLEKEGIIVRLFIMGSGSYKKELQRQAKDLPYVSFVMSKPLRYFMREMSQSHIVIIPHLENDNNNASSPNKLFQAMYAGVTLIVSSCRSIREIITEENCGYFYQAGNYMDLVHLLIAIDRDRSMLNLGENGRKAVERRYNWEHDSKALIRLYNYLEPRP